MKDDYIIRFPKQKVKEKSMLHILLHNIFKSVKESPVAYLAIYEIHEKNINLIIGYTDKAKHITHIVNLETEIYDNNPEWNMAIDCENISQLLHWYEDAKHNPYYGKPPFEGFSKLYDWRTHNETRNLSETKKIIDYQKKLSGKYYHKWINVEE